MKNNFSQFVKRVLWMSFSIMFMVATFNVLVDPFNYFGVNGLGVYISGEREAKARYIHKIQHNAIIIGNSKAAMIAASDIKSTRYRFFNAAFGGAALYEIESFLRHHIDKEELVLFSVDLGQDDLDEPQNDVFKPWRTGDIIDKTLNLQTIEYSIRTISKYLSHASPQIAPDGSFITGQRFDKLAKENPQNGINAIAEAKSHFETYTRRKGHGMAAYRRIANCLREKGIKCVVFIPPLHSDIADSILKSPGNDALKVWKRELLEIFPNTTDFSTGVYSKAEGFFTFDPIHFKPEVGAALINEQILPIIDYDSH